jgi:hypothetical protein
MGFHVSSHVIQLPTKYFVLTLHVDIPLPPKGEAVVIFCFQFKIYFNFTNTAQDFPRFCDLIINDCGLR